MGRRSGGKLLLVTGVNTVSIVLHGQDFLTKYWQFQTIIE